MHIYRKRKKPYLKYILIAAIFFVLGYNTPAIASINNSPGDITSLNQPSGEETKTDLALFWRVWEKLEVNYVDEEKIDYQDMNYGAIQGMVNSLGDPYTVFMTPDESKEFSASLEGTLEGIGAELTVEEGNLIVVTPLRDSPAEEAGLLSGDIIYKVDGEITYEMSLFEAIMNIRGEKGTEVVLTIIRNNLDEPFDIPIIRDSIEIESVTSESLDSGITYLSINQFNDKTLEEFNKAVSEMLLSDPQGLIIDLRYNGGGYLDIAVDLLSYLLPARSEAVKIKQRNSENETILTKGTPQLPNIPIVVLVNEGSASASEILAGAIQSHDRGIVMGTQSFGKGTVQEVEMFPDGSSMRVTIAKWFTPDEVNINDTGLTPDIIVEISEQDIKNEYDRQKEEALKYLENIDTAVTASS